VALYKDLLSSQEWRSLSSSAKVVYVYMRGKFNTKTLSEVSLAYSEMADMMSPATLSKSFKELQEFGFIKKEKNGGLFGGVTTYTFNGKFSDFHYKGFKV
jgi:hypothetical protein